MVTMIRKIFERGRLKRNLIAFLDEMEKNLETFYVMDQRQFITQGFSVLAWEQVKQEDAVKKHGPVLVYIRAMEDFNRSFQKYEENKTPMLKNELDKKLKGLDAVIIPAGQALEREMIRLGILKA